MDERFRNLLLDSLPPDLRERVSTVLGGHDQRNLATSSQPLNNGILSSIENAEHSPKTDFGHRGITSGTCSDYRNEEAYRFLVVSPLSHKNSNRCNMGAQRAKASVTSQQVNAFGIEKRTSPADLSSKKRLTGLHLYGYTTPHRRPPSYPSLREAGARSGSQLLGRPGSCRLRSFRSLDSGMSKGSFKSFEMPFDDILLNSPLEKAAGKVGRSSPTSTAWYKNRLRKRKDRSGVLEDPEDSISAHGPLLPSIENDDIDLWDVPLSPSRPRTESRGPSPCHQNGDEFEVKRVVGEKKGPNKHQFLLEWVDYEVRNWIPSYNCSCPDLIEEFRQRQCLELIMAQRQGRAELVEILQCLTVDDMAAVDDVKFPIVKGWKLSRRNASNGQFQRPGLGNSMVEVVRLPTETPNTRNIRANTAFFDSKTSSTDHSAATDQDVIWIESNALPLASLHGNLISIKREPIPHTPFTRVRPPKAEYAEIKETAIGKIPKDHSMRFSSIPRVGHKGCSNRKKKAKPVLSLNRSFPPLPLRPVSTPHHGASSKISKDPTERSYSSIRRSVNRAQLKSAFEQQAQLRDAETPSIVRSEFRYSLGRKAARSLVNKAKIASRNLR